eukprot:TRINITY_DN1542_c0_g1_i1.p1 TRINITY_DN1542_c0_g1~~TRINITY_DN1542_c0_g1_i1.p1  ORF type:complete len:285 (-),score=94.69 TRINITY_DN1542_c0_g1_i1:42-896(-)
MGKKDSSKSNQRERTEEKVEKKKEGPKKQEGEKRTEKKGYTLESIWGFSLFGLFFAISFVIQLVLFPFLYFVDKRRDLLGRIFRGAAVNAVKLNPLWDFKIQGEVPSKLPEATICVSNHLSIADPAIISHLPWEMKWLSKASVGYIPFVGWGMVVAGDILVKRGNKDSAKMAMKKCAEWLKVGANVMIFPEGTRTRDGVLGEFKDGAFRLAIETQSDILPLAILGTEKAIPVRSWKMAPSVGRVTVGKPISTKGMTIKDLENLKKTSREQIEELYQQLQRTTQQ